MTKIRVLLVESDPTVASQIDSMLAGASIHFSIDIACSTEEAAQNLSDYRYNVALVDFKLKAEAEIPVFVKLHADFPWLAIVVMTSEGDGAIPTELRSAAHSVISKQFLSEEGLLKAIQRAVRQHRSDNEQAKQAHNSAKQLVLQVKGDLIRIDDAVTQLEKCSLNEQGREAVGTIRTNARRIAARMDDMGE